MIEFKKVIFVVFLCFRNNMYKTISKLFENKNGHKNIQRLIIGKKLIEFYVKFITLHA